MTSERAIEKREATTLAAGNFNPATMMQAIVDKGITSESVGVMNSLLAMKRDMDKDEARKAFNRAFVALQRDLRPVQALREIPDNNGRIRSTFASFEDLMTDVRPILERHGFGIVIDKDGDARAEGAEVDERDADELEKRVGRLCGGDAAAMERWKRLAGGSFANIREDKYRIVSERLAVEERAKVAPRRRVVDEEPPPPVEESDAPFEEPPSQEPSIPLCPQDPALWRAGIEEVFMAKQAKPGDLTEFLSKQAKKCGASSYLTLPVEARKAIWNTVHARASK